jgi:hypothetical protein
MAATHGARAEIVPPKELAFTTRKRWAGLPALAISAERVRLNRRSSARTHLTLIAAL